MFRELGLHSTTTRPRVRPRERWRDYVFLLAFEGLTTPPHTHTLEELEEVVAGEGEVWASMTWTQSSIRKRTNGWILTFHSEI